MVDYSRDIDLGNLSSYKTKKVDWVTRYGYKTSSFSFRPWAIEQSLSGDQRYVTYMFTWAESPKELSETWGPCQDGNYREYRYPFKPLDEEQKTFLKWLIRDEIKDEGE